MRMTEVKLHSGGRGSMPTEARFSVGDVVSDLICNQTVTITDVRWFENEIRNPEDIDYASDGGLFTGWAYKADYGLAYDGSICEDSNRWWAQGDYVLLKTREQRVDEVVGTQREWSSGAVRDSNTGKPRPDLISPKATIRRAVVLAEGAEHYGARNWEKGIYASVFLESLERHLLNYKLGDRSEDHLARAAFNLDGIMHFEGTEWDDINTPNQRSESWLK